MVRLCQIVLKLNLVFFYYTAKNMRIDRWLINGTCGRLIISFTWGRLGSHYGGDVADHIGGYYVILTHYSLVSKYAQYMHDT